MKIYDLLIFQLNADLGIPVADPFSELGVKFRISFMCYFSGQIWHSNIQNFMPISNVKAIF